MMQETRVRSLGWEVPLEKGMAIYSSILAWRSPWTEKPGGYSPWGHKELDMTEQLIQTYTTGSGCDLYGMRHRSPTWEENEIKQLLVLESEFLGLNLSKSVYPLGQIIDPLSIASGTLKWAGKDDYKISSISIPFSWDHDENPVE